jgi:GxxExxY protein
MRSQSRRDLKHGRLSYDLVGCAMDVHRELGPGQDERLYHLALCKALRQKGIPFEYKPRGRLIHRGLVADEFEADLIVDDRIIVELKAIESGFVPEHFTQLICYLKFWGRDLGLLMDFGKESLVHKRVPYSERSGEVDAESVEDHIAELMPEDRELANSMVAALVRLHDQYGLGYRDTTYLGLLCAEFSAEETPFTGRPSVPLTFAQRELGVGELSCFVVRGRCAIKVYALYDRVHAWQRATVQAYVRHLGVPFGLVANFGKRALEICAVHQR